MQGVREEGSATLHTLLRGIPSFETVTPSRAGAVGEDYELGFGHPGFEVPL